MTQKNAPKAKDTKNDTQENDIKNPLTKRQFLTDNKVSFQESLMESFM